MGNSYSNKWLSNNCPTVNTFNVNKSNTSYWINYYNAKKNVVELNTDMNSIDSGVKKLIQDIEALKAAIDSEDYRSKTADIEQALTASVDAIKGNMNKLFNSCVRRLQANAETDSWFGDNAANYARYINESILKKQ